MLKNFAKLILFVFLVISLLPSCGKDEIIPVPDPEIPVYPIDDTVVYIGSWDHNFYALHASDGSKK